jgi:hypothetical protein
MGEAGAPAEHCHPQVARHGVWPSLLAHLGESMGHIVPGVLPGMPDSPAETQQWCDLGIECDCTDCVES